MASAMASMASRNVTPYTIPVGPRVRPPRLLPGTKDANTDPKPNEAPPTPAHTWVQGKWRNPASNAARHQREVNSVRAEKALRLSQHGMNIYAYSNIRTNQVVYSLTRKMQNSNVLSQLLYHGKKTVPAALRRDIWRPYFSMHFPETLAGAESGLKAYRQLRELANLRQLSPPRELITATEEDVQKAKEKYSPAELKDKSKDYRFKQENIPVKDRLLPRKFRAKRLMDQKASSVADAAYVLNLINEARRSPEMAYDAILRARARKLENLSQRATRRLDRIREKETAKDAEIEARKEAIQPAEGDLGLTAHAARRIALEHGGFVTAPRKGVEYAIEQRDTNMLAESAISMQHTVAHRPRSEKYNAAEFRANFIKGWQENNHKPNENPPEELLRDIMQQKRKQVEGNSRRVDMLWADLRDATWAQKWSDNVYHGELESRAAIKHERRVVAQNTTIDEDGNTLPKQVQRRVVQGQSTSHVIGVNNQDAWYESPAQMEEKRVSERSLQWDKWKSAKLERSKEVFDRIDSLYQQQGHVAPEDDEIAIELQKIQQRHEQLFTAYQHLNEWRSELDVYETLLRSKAEVEALQRDFNHEDIEASTETFNRLQEITAELNSHLAEENKLPHSLEGMDAQEESAKNELQIATFKAADDLIDSIKTKIDLFENEKFQDIDIAGILQQRLAAKEEGDTERVAKLNADLRIREDDLIAELLQIKVRADETFQITQPIETRELSEADREKGIEMPPPPSRSIMSRLTGIFRR